MNKPNSIKMKSQLKKLIEAGTSEEEAIKIVKEAFKLPDFEMEAFIEEEDVTQLIKVAKRNVPTPSTKKDKEDTQPIPIIEIEPEDYTTGYYRKALGLTYDPRHNLEVLCKFYKERMGSNEDDFRIKETLNEYINLFKGRGLDGEDVIADRISMVSRKSSNDKHTLHYLVGCLRHNLLFGLESINPKVDKFLFSLFEREFQTPLTESGRKRLLRLVTKYGILEVIMSIVQFEAVPADELILNGIDATLKSQSEKD